MNAKKRVLILCTGNSARSQIAEGLLRHLGNDAGDRFEVESAGTRPSRVRPEAIAVMRELGIDISDHRSKGVDEFAGRQFDYLLTVCDNARESCPIYPGPVSYTHLHGRQNDRLFHLLNPGRIGELSRVIDLDQFAVCGRHTIAHAGRGSDQVDIEFALQALLSLIHI